MPQAKRDFTPIDETVQKQTLTFDFAFQLAPGDYLRGTPVVICTVVSGIDSNPSSRLIGPPSIGTPSPPLGSGVPNTGVLQQFGNALPGVVYLLFCECDTFAGDVSTLWARIACVTPA